MGPGGARAPPRNRPRCPRRWPEWAGLSGWGPESPGPAVWGRAGDRRLCQGNASGEVVVGAGAWTKAVSITSPEVASWGSAVCSTAARPPLWDMVLGQCRGPGQ